MTRSFGPIAMVACPTVLVAVLTAGLVVPTLGQPYAPGYQPYQPYQTYPAYRTYSRERERERRRDEERESRRGDCKGEQVVATGGTRPTTRWAMRAANATWSRLVTASYGQEWSDVTVSKERWSDCFPGVLGGRACKVAATPCKARRVYERAEPR